MNDNYMNFQAKPGNGISGEAGNYITRPRETSNSLIYFTKDLVIKFDCALDVRCRQIKPANCVLHLAAPFLGRTLAFRGS